MDRDFDLRERPESERPHPIHSQPKTDSLQQPHVFDLRGYRYEMTASAWASLQEIGRFRTLATDDLRTYRYEGSRERLKDDLHSLRSQGLIRQLNVFAGRHEKLNVLTLTKVGKKLLQAHNESHPKQRYYAGVVKRAEVRHDAAIFRMYQTEAARIFRDGGRIRRIVLDYELKQGVYRPLAKIQPRATAREYAQRQAEVAAQNGLKVVGGKILLPDLRIEFETAQGISSSVDLELATDHYRGSAMCAKAAAGFKIYAAHESAARLAASFDPELVAEIFSF